MRKETKTGYKKTKIGWIPQDWQVRTLESVTSLIQDGTHFSPKSQENGDFKYITSKNIKNGRLDLTDVSFISEDSHKNIYKKCPVKFGDVLLTKDGASTGNVCINPLKEEFSILSSIALIRANPKLTINQFLYQLISSPKGQFLIKDSMAGQAITRVTLQIIKGLQFSFPPLPEQRKIAQILSTWDKAIELTEKLIAAKERRKKGLMQQLLTGKRRFSGFKDNSWQTKQLKDLGEIISGGTPDTSNEKYWNGHINWCTPTDITALRWKYLGETVRRLSQKGLENSSARLLPVGSLIVCTRATIGDCAINTVPMTTNQGFKSIVPNPKTNVEFLYYWMVLNKHQLLRLGAGSTFFEVPKSDFAKLNISIPSLLEQKKIASALSNCDNEINLLNKKLDHLKQQKKGSMQKLLTGRIRVNTEH